MSPIPDVQIVDMPRRRSPMVCLESPFAGATAVNIQYADVALLHSIEAGEVPFAGHLLYTRVLDDVNPAHRELGISCHLLMLSRCDLVVMYCDLGISRGMRLAAETAARLHIPIEQRELGADWMHSSLAARVARSADV